MVCRRAVILLSVLVLVTLSALVGSTLMLQAVAIRGATEREIGQAQSRAIAWSGVQVVMAELAASRSALLDGEGPVLEAESVLYGGTSGVEGVYRLLPFGDGRLAAPEGAKLDLNTATAEMLAGLPGVGEELARRIVSRRDSSVFTSVDDLLGVEGVTAVMLRGGRGSASVSSSGDPFGDASGDLGGAAGPLAALVTVFSFDPQVQCGIGREESRGRQRVFIGGAWSEELGEAVTERFGEGASAGLKALFDSGVTFGKPGDLLRIMVDRGLPVELAAQVLDVFTTAEGAYAFGQVDLNTASSAVLACVPGLDEDAAAAIVDARERIGPADRLSVLWPVEQGLVPMAAFVEAVDWLTVRSTQWRVLIEAGTRAAGRTAGEDFGAGAGFDPDLVMPELTADEFGVAIIEEDAEPELRDRVVYEAVIDVSAERPRLAYFAEVSGRAFLLEAESLGSGRESGAESGAELGAGGAPEAEGPGGDRPAEEGQSGYVDDGAMGIDRGSLVDRTGFGDEQADRGGRDGDASTSSGGSSAAGSSSGGGAAGRLGRWRAGKGREE